MFCKNCGAELEDGAKVCSQCGTPIENTEGKTEQPAQAPYQAQQNAYNTAQQPAPQYQQYQQPVSNGSNTLGHSSALSSRSL